MKHLLTLAFLFLVTVLTAQDFEGIMKWKITSEITDPKMKAQMEEAQKKANDPATQAQMKELQAKMEDPQFKQMMENNPQMKAQMEAALKMAQGGDINSIMPKGYTAKFKNKNMVSVMEGGMMSDMEVLYLAGEDKVYMINRSAKTYSPMASNATQEKKDVDVKVTKTSETTRILNYTCTKYIAEVKSEKGQTMQQIFWTTKDIPGIDFKSMAKQRLGNSNQRMWYAEIDGVPLKLEMKMPQANMVMEATEIKKQSMPASDFAIPEGFKEKSLGF
ncbi:DUF4412 domain-containing protein [Chryseolinea sp. T2]|uniref:DUF4412 domain-containing protein n=1 Tax=Chryseolinea sp. T2 TaxID=3129255 RepID=UPI003077D426